jgi:hypothetical protein
MRLRKLSPAREHILYALLIFRTIPVKYITKGISPKGDRTLTDSVYTLLTSNYIVETRNAWRERFIYLTEKGYKYLQEKLLHKEQLQYSFMRSRKRRTTFSPHEYMNLQFVWKYMTENWENLINGDVDIYTDTDINNCKLQFINKWGSLEIRPDVMIKIYEEGLNKKLIMAENDTGSMNTIQIYREK